MWALIRGVQGWPLAVRWGCLWRVGMLAVVGIAAAVGAAVGAAVWLF